MENAKVKVDLSSVHETLLLPLWGRAEAAKMKNPILKDRQAAELVEHIDYDFSKFRPQFRRLEILILALRAREFDSIIRDFIQDHPGATVVNIGAGLDTTFYRVNNGRIKWYDLDVPQVIRLRSELLPKPPEAAAIPKSMFDESFLDDIAAPRDGILFLAGGVLMYFDEAKVREFLAMLARRFPGGEIVFDSIAPSILRAVSRMVQRSGISGAEMKWGIRSAAEMEHWGLGLKLLEQYPVSFKTRIYPSWGFPIRFAMRLNNAFSLININRMAFGPVEK
ncbi:MAG TPA: class I SAM-dependent methyltransferase [Ruminococcaceae bacterium]|jgi:O-methyltransferase involved in polyketide biosynthesis|nr:class I SAM-dependent methyltransferase [Oscillospiraceae bacterium]